MADKKAQAMERLAAKLTALRRTLRGEERNLLDAMVLGAQPEVSAHSKNFRLTQTSTPKASARQSSDVEMHSANVRRLDPGQKAGSAVSRQTPGAKAAGPEARWDLRIVLEDGNYRVSTL